MKKKTQKMRNKVKNIEDENSIETKKPKFSSIFYSDFLFFTFYFLALKATKSLLAFLSFLAAVDAAGVVVVFLSSFLPEGGALEASFA